MSELTGDAGSYEAITPGDVATAITRTITDPVTGIFAGLKAKSLLVTVEDNTVTVAFDGTTPTLAAGTNAGHKLNAGDSLVLYNSNTIRQFMCVDTVSGSAGVVKVTCFF